MDDYMERSLSQIKRARSLATFLPNGALSFGSTDLAGTGVLAYGSYLRFLQSGRDQIADALKRRWDMPPNEGTALVQEVIEEVNRRQYQAEPLRESLLSAARPFITLAVWALVLALLALYRSQRYDVT